MRLVSRLQQALRALGVKPGDRVAAMLPNMPEAIAGMLAAASLGAIWSSCSPDFGVEGVLDRFGQIEPVLFIASTATGTTASDRRCRQGAAVLARLPSVRKRVHRRLPPHAPEGGAGIPRGRHARRRRSRLSSRAD